VKSKREYIIPFIGLKLGFHEFEFQIQDAFFEDRQYSSIHSGTANVRLVLEKKETMMIGEFEIKGSVSTDCDRCNDPIEVPIKGSFKLIFTFGNEPSEDESIIVMHPDDYELELKDHLYELLIVSLPTRLIHPKGECNEEMIELLSKYTVQQEPSGSEDDDDEDDDDEDDWDFEDDDDYEDDEDWEDEDEDDDSPIDPRWNKLKDIK
jgi:uncharacterized metal-binding protein YceD (DUF177 family)